MASISLKAHLETIEVFQKGKSYFSVSSVYDFLNTNDKNPEYIYNYINFIKVNYEWSFEKKILKLIELRYIHRKHLMINIVQRYIKHEELHLARILVDVLEKLFPNDDKIKLPNSLILMQELKFREAVSVINSLEKEKRDKPNIRKRLLRAKKMLDK